MGITREADKDASLNTTVGRTVVVISGARNAMERKSVTRMTPLSGTGRGVVTKIVAPMNENGHHHLNIFQIP